MRESYCIFLVAFLFESVTTDIYLHNPRGSNNRLNEEGRERNNGNRLFDSQNNNRGGYNVGSLYYYSGSVLPIEWTNQHSCQNAKSHCEIILQYICADTVRDGVNTRTIPENPMECQKYDCNTDTRYGMHENFDFYLNCKIRERNKGLFTADQNLKGNRRTAKHTRQNPGGTRRGYECPEERDYYPYWHPSPWKDIAILTNNASRCPYYETESENVKSRWACVIPHNVMVKNGNRGVILPNNENDCKTFRFPNDETGVYGKWKKFSSHKLPPPECRETQFSRDNHLGNGIDGYPNLYNWTIPNVTHERCLIRIRYNISTDDYNGLDGSVTHINNEPRLAEGTQIDLSTRYNFLNQEEARQRGYIFKNNPEVQLFPDANFELELAINTAQYGRTFQDRSHSFAIRQRPGSIGDAMIHNINVRGKRGNIVQVYPGVEYDFVPNTLKMSSGEYVHLQWTGSNTNPNNNDGQGRAGTDRSNVVLQDKQIYAEGSVSMNNKFGHWGRSYPAHLNNATFLGFSKEDMEKLALVSNQQFRGDMSELDDAGTYFDIGPKLVTQIGTYHYMSTRNNNFSNRSQKGKIVVVNYPIVVRSIGWNGGQIEFTEASVAVDRGVFLQLHTLTMEAWHPEDGLEKIKSVGREMSVGDGFASKFIVLYPASELTSVDKSFGMKIKVDDSSNSEIHIYYSNPENFATWTRIDAEVVDGYAQFNAREGGVFVARTVSSAGVIIGIVLAVVIVITIVLGTVIYCRKYPQKWDNFSAGIRSVSRSMQAKV